MALLSRKKLDPPIQEDHGCERKKGLRIIDILREPDHSDATGTSNEISSAKGTGGGDSRSSSASASSFSPVKSVVSHWLVWRMKKRRDDSGRDEERQGRGLGCFKRVLNGKSGSRTAWRKDEPALSPPSTSSLDIDVDQKKTKLSNLEEEQNEMGNGNELNKPTFHIGVGVGLIYLLAKTSQEFKKMTELRKEMEIAVKESRESFMQSKDANVTGAVMSMESTHSAHFSESSSDKISYNNVSFRGCDGKPENANHVQKNQLEAELESELLQLQHNLEIGKRVEVFDHSITDSENECDNYVEEEEDDIHIETEWGQNYGVCPYELERRLHELLEARQDQQIVQLESALENSERELQQKEREIYWLKNASSLLQSASTKSC